MKKLILFAAGFIALNVASAQTNTATYNGITTPSNVSTKFETDYPNTRGTWTRDGDYYRSEYLSGNPSIWHAAVYDADGALLYTETQEATGYPEGITTYYTTTYPNQSYLVWSVTDTDGSRNYYVTRGTERVWFDSEGKYDKAGKTKHNKSKNKTKAKSNSKK